MLAPADHPHRRPSAAEVHQPGRRRTARPSALSPRSQARAQSYGSRSGGCCARSDMHLRRHHPACSQKRGCRPLAGSILSTKDLWHPARSIRPASGHHDPNHPVARPSPTPYVRERCAATAGRGPDGYRTRHAFLGRSAAAGEGTASAFFHKQDGGRTAGMSPRHGIHPIAIRRRRPWLEGRCIGSSDGTPAGTSCNGSFRNGQRPVEGGAAPDVLPCKTLASAEGSCWYSERVGWKLGSRSRRG